MRRAGVEKKKAELRLVEALLADEGLIPGKTIIAGHGARALVNGTASLSGNNLFRIHGWGLKKDGMAGRRELVFYNWTVVGELE